MLSSISDISCHRSNNIVNRLASGLTDELFVGGLDRVFIRRFLRIDVDVGVLKCSVRQTKAKFCSVSIMLIAFKHMIESRLTKARGNVVRIKPPIVYLQLFSKVCLGCNAVIFRYGVWRII